MAAAKKDGDSAEYVHTGGSGDIIYREGESSQDLYIVEEGEVELLKKIGGKHRRLGLLTPGEFFGETELLERGNRDTSARGVSEFKVVKVSPAIFEQMIRDQPDIALYMLRKLSRRLRSKQEKRAASETESSAAKPAAKAAASSDKSAAEKKPGRQSDKSAAAAPKQAKTSRAGSEQSAGKASAAQSGAKAKAADDKAGKSAKPRKGAKTGEASGAKKPAKSRSKKSGEAKSKPSKRETAFTPVVPVDDVTDPDAGKSGTATYQLIHDPSGTPFPLQAEGSSTIGRIDRSTGRSPDVDFTEVDENRTLSRRHAKITKRMDGYYLEEQKGAHNGTFVNGKQLQSGESHRLKNGDQLQFGHVKAVFKSA